MGGNPKPAAARIIDPHNNSRYSDRSKSWLNESSLTIPKPSERTVAIQQRKVRDEIDRAVAEVDWANQGEMTFVELEQLLFNLDYLVALKNMAANPKSTMANYNTTFLDDARKSHDFL